MVKLHKVFVKLMIARSRCSTTEGNVSTIGNACQGYVTKKLVFAREDLRVNLVLTMSNAIRR
jgi:hypothetical protein